MSKKNNQNNGVQSQHCSEPRNGSSDLNKQHIQAPLGTQILTKCVFPALNNNLN